MPENLIPLAASAPTEHITVLISSTIKWLWGAVSTVALALIGVCKWFFNRQEATNTRVAKLETKHDQDIKAFMSHCSDRHEREFTRSTDFATKSDVDTLHSKIDVLTENVQAINTNVCNLAMNMRK